MSGRASVSEVRIAGRLRRGCGLRIAGRLRRELLGACGVGADCGLRRRRLARRRLPSLVARNAMKYNTASGSSWVRTNGIRGLDMPRVVACRGAEFAKECMWAKWLRL